jgi:hypothetical protein
MASSREAAAGDRVVIQFGPGKSHLVHLVTIRERGQVSGVTACCLPVVLNRPADQYKDSASRRRVDCLYCLTNIVYEY